MSERRDLVLLAVAVCVAVQVAYVARSVPLQSANDRSRWATIRALVEDDTYVIDRLQTDRTDRSWSTIDVVRHERDGETHFYSTKPPLMPTLVAGLVGGIERTIGLSLAADTTQATRLVLLLVNAVPMAVALWLIGRLALHFVDGAFGPAVVVLAAGIGTMHLPFVASLNNHTIALWATAIALAASHRFHVSDDANTQRLAAATAGLFAMWACCNELPAALFGLTLFGWFLRENWKRTLLWFAPAALVPLAGFFWTNYEATGGWKPFYMYYGTEKYEYVYEGRPSYWMDPQGIDANRDDSLTYAMHCLVGHHGLFSLTPVLLVAVAGAFLWRRHPSRWLRFWAVAAGLLTAAVFAFFMTRTENYNYGGVSVALRWMLWLTPLWAILMMAALKAATSRWLRAIVSLLLAVSIASAMECGANPWQHNWLFLAMEQAGWIAY